MAIWERRTRSYPRWWIFVTSTTGSAARERPQPCCGKWLPPADAASCRCWRWAQAQATCRARRSSCSRAEGIELSVTLLDRAWSHLPGNGVASVAGDALQLPFCDDAFDVVSCSLFAHHFQPDALQAFARESLRVSRRALLINDLIRSRLHLWLVYAGLPLFRSRITWHDAPASVRNAYTVEEVRQILQGLPAQRITISRHNLYRMGVLVWKKQSAVS